METAKFLFLKKIKGICKKHETCTDCPFCSVLCYSTPEHWSDSEIEDMAKTINSYEEEEEKDV